MGSSVTAGHDTLFNITFPTLTGVVMAPPFTVLGIELETRNAAMGNNPCLPYDVCVHAFAGKDADIVHWEQSYNCFGNDPQSHVPFEHFLRQSLSLPNQAVVVFSESSTPNWESKDCAADKVKPLTIPEEEKKLWDLAKKDPVKLVTEVNRLDRTHSDTWSAMNDLFKTYKIAGIQTWSHQFYESYKCHGPYIADWGCCSAGWHPSKLGHELRADHYSYFWLLIFKSALEDILKVENLEEHTKHVKKRVHFEHRYVPKDIVHPSTYSDTLSCYTSFQPLADPDLSLFGLVLSKTAVNGKEPFKSDIMENFIDKNIIETAKKRGYKDFKVMLYGDKDSLPLSLKLDIKHEGTVHVCEPPGNWGNLPDGFKSFYKDGNAKAFVTDVSSYDNFVFDQSKAKEVGIVDLKKGTQFVCAEIEGKFKVGKYVLTLVPTKTDKIMISFLILP